jgi:hypothetical protein
MATTYPVHCGFCGALLAVASHIVNGVYCGDPCFEHAGVGRRKVRDVPSERTK